MTKYCSLLPVDFMFRVHFRVRSGVLKLEVTWLFLSSSPQIRKDALKSLNIAYTVSTQRCTAFPLDHLVRMLLFRDREEATDFISYYGLSVSDG